MTIKKIFLFSAVMLLLSACTGREVITGVAQLEADKHCDPMSDVSYLRCGTDIDDEYEKNRALKEQHMREADEELRQKELERLKK
jgi:hypothetical protein